MKRVSLGPVTSFESASRYTISLESSKQLVLFKLSQIDNRQCHKNSDGGFEYFCMNQECPHAGGPMEDSAVEYDIEDNTWVASCPWHSYDFNVETGESSSGFKTCTYPITIEAGEIWLDYPTEISIIGTAPVSEAFKASQNSPPLLILGTTGVVDGGLGPAKYPKRNNSTICDWCVDILNTSDPESKIQLTQHFSRILSESSQEVLPVGQNIPPDVPPRISLRVIDPSRMPKLGRAGNVKSRIAILHSLANIEQWAIDLALDICARFSTFETTNGLSLPRQFFLDWIKVANDEAKHFSLLRGRLEELGSYFGELPVHHGLWDSAALTAHDLRARISIIALVHEARGLDVNPQTIKKFRTAGDLQSVQALETIHKDEITHVTTGHRWLSWICEQEGHDPVKIFRANVAKFFRGAVKGPFNSEDRTKAGLQKDYYENLEGRPRTVLITGG